VSHLRPRCAAGEMMCEHKTNSCDGCVGVACGCWRESGVYDFIRDFGIRANMGRAWGVLVYFMCCRFCSPPPFPLMSKSRKADVHSHPNNIMKHTPDLQPSTTPPPTTTADNKGNKAALHHLGIEDIP